MSWTKDNRAEVWLKSFGLECGYTDRAPLAKFIPDWKKVNPGRPGLAMMDDYILAYAEAMSSGKAFPSVILLETPCGYQPLDGLQRCAAAELNNETAVAAFIVPQGTSAQTIYIISRCANFILNGVQPPKEFQIEQALRLVDENGLSPDEAAAAIGLSKEQIGRALNRRFVIRALNAEGVEAAGQVNGALDVLRPLVDKDPKIAAEVFKVHAAAKLHADETGALAKTIVKQTSRGEMIKVLNRFKSEPNIRERLNNAGMRKVAPTDRLLYLLRSLKTFITDHGNEVYFGTEDERLELDRMTKWLNGRLQLLMKNARCNV